MNRRLTRIAVLIMVALGADAKASDWETDFAKAATNASRSSLYMLLDFSGSDWCGFCMKLDEEVFTKPDFKRFAKENLVCVLVDFPHQKSQSKKLKDQNAGLAEKYQHGGGYPTVVVLSPAGELVDKITGYKKGGAKNYVELLRQMIGEHKKQHSKPDKPVAAPGKTGAVTGTPPTNIPTTPNPSGVTPRNLGETNRQARLEQESSAGPPANGIATLPIISQTNRPSLTTNDTGYSLTFETNTGQQWPCGQRPHGDQYLGVSIQTSRFSGWTMLRPNKGHVSNRQEVSTTQEICWTFACREILPASVVTVEIGDYHNLQPSNGGTKLSALKPVCWARFVTPQEQDNAWEATADLLPELGRLEASGTSGHQTTNDVMGRVTIKRLGFTDSASFVGTHLHELNESKSK